MEKEKKYSLLKVIGIAFLFYVVLTWFIPTGNFSSGEFAKGETAPVGIYGIFTSPIYSFSVFAQYMVLLLCVGGFYGVLNKTGAYQKIVAKFSSFSKVKFLIATVIIFALISSFFGEAMMLFILLPFFVAVLSKLGYNKLSCIASTVGAYIVGMIASICGNLAIYKNYFGLEPKVFILFNIILLIILIFLLCLFIISKDKDSSSLKKEEIPLFEVVKDNKKSVLPLAIILILVLLFLVLGLFNWQYAFGIDLFTNIHEKITSIELFGTNIISKIFGELSPIGYLSNYDISAVLLISSCLIAWVYSIKFSDLVASFKKGAMEMLLPGIYVIFASVIFSQIATANDGNISLTISNFFLKLSDDFNIISGGLTGIIGSFFYNDYIYLLNGLYPTISLYNADMMPFILSVFQSTFGIMMMVLPVSIALIGGLKYLNVSYKDWIKYIWKFLLQIFAISIIGCIILSMII